MKGQATKFKVLGEILDAQEEGSSIIYAATRRAVEEIASFLHERGTEALIYTPGCVMLNGSALRTRLWRASAV